MDPLALVFVVGFFAITAAYFFVEPPKDNAAALNLIVGAIIGIIGTIATFRWGSSDSAKVKSETIAAAIAPQEPKP
jgi:lipopolysaccharide export LptBFGC system permease protein LptF